MSLEKPFSVEALGEVNSAATKALEMIEKGVPESSMDTIKALDGVLIVFKRGFGSFY